MHPTSLKSHVHSLGMESQSIYGRTPKAIGCEECPEYGSFRFIGLMERNFVFVIPPIWKTFENLLWNGPNKSCLRKDLDTSKSGELNLI